MDPGTTNGNWNDTGIVSVTADTGLYPNTPPATVTGFDATDNQIGQVTLTWTNPSDTDLAEVLVLRKPASYPTSHSDGAATTVYSGVGISHTDIGVAEGVTYYYAAFTRDTNGNWNDTGAVGTRDMGLHPDTPPAAATGFNASDDQIGQVTLSWINPSDTDLDAIVVRRKVDSYPLSHNDGSLTYQSGGTPTPGAFESVTDIGTVDEGTTYYYAVFTSDTLGNWNDTVVTGMRDTGIYPDTAPNRVTDFDASDNQPNLVTLSWTNPSDTDLDEVRVLRKVGSYPAAHNDGTAITVYQNLVPISGAVVNTTDSSVTEGTVYYYAVFGKDSLSNWNDTINVGDNANTGTFPNTPPVISSIVHNPSEFSATITWDTDEASDSLVEYGLTAAYGSSQSAATQVTSHSIALTGFIPGTEYHYRVSSTDGFGNTSVSLDRTFTTVNTLAPATVTDFIATDNQALQVTLTWTNPSDGDLAEVLVLRKEGNYPTSHTDAGATQVHLDSSPVPGGSKNVVDSSGTEGTTYYYAVFSHDDAANWNDVILVGQNADTGLALDVTMPGTVTGFNATDDQTGQVTLSWVNPVDPDLAEVLVTRKAGSYPTDHLDAGATTVYTGLGTGAVDSPVTEGVTYYYAAWTRDTNNNWNDTGSVSVTADTGLYPNTPPATVTGFAATDSQIGQVTLTWTNPSDGDFAEVVVLRKTGSYPTDHSDAGATPVYSGVGISNHTDMGVAEGVTYYYAAFTRDTNGNWNDTRIVSVTADTGLYPNTPPATAIGFNASDNQISQVTLSWINPSDADLDAIVVRRKVGSYPLNHNDGSLAYQSGGTPLPGVFESVTDIGTVGEGTTYYYAVFTSDTLGNWNDTVAAGMRDTGIYPDTPPARITDFDASDNQLNLVTLSWTNPADLDLDEVRVLRKTGSYPTVHDDGTAITVYQNLVPISGAVVNTTDSSVTEGTVYYYAVFGKDSLGNWNDTVIGGDNANTGTFPDTLPVISNIVHNPDEFTATITWDTDEASDSLVQYGLTAAYGSSQSAATLVTSHSITLTGLTPGMEYHYRVSSSDGSGNTSVSLDRTFTTKNLSSPATVSDFKATDDKGSQITLTWTNPSDGDLAEVLLLRKEGDFPTSHTDPVATEVYRGIAPRARRYGKRGGYRCGGGNRHLLLRSVQP